MYWRLGPGTGAIDNQPVRKKYERPDAAVPAASGLDQVAVGAGAHDPPLT